MQWQRIDLDFPVLMLRTSPWTPSVASVGGGPAQGLSTVGISYGEGEEVLRLETLARRGRRMGPHEPPWIGDQLQDVAGRAVADLHLSRIRPGSQPASATRRRVDEAVRHGQQLAAQFPDPPWQVRSVPVDDVDFALWSAAFPDGFAAVLDYGPVMLAAWGAVFDDWDWQLTAVSPDEVWPLIDDVLSG